MVRIAPGGWRLARPSAWLAALAALAAWVRRQRRLAAVSLASFAVTLIVLAFHRDPPRSPAGPGVLAPADGTVSVIREEGDRVRVGIYMHPTSVHVNRAPIGGAVEQVTHVQGGHVPAFSKESDRNERVHIDIGDHRVTLIAGAVARRIRPYVATGDTLERGERIGHISFGSRADVLLPAAYDRGDLAVGTDESVRAGETVLAPPPDRV